MPPTVQNSLLVTSRKEWRNWLKKNWARYDVIWLVFTKRTRDPRSLSDEIIKPGRVVQTFTYEDAVEEALCFGWIDSIVSRIDDNVFARKFTPRKPESKWSSINRKRYASLESRGLLAKPGLARPPTNRSSIAPARYVMPDSLPPYISAKLKANQKAWQYFQTLAPSYRRAYIGWIDSAKRQETKEKRLQEAIGLLAAGKRLGLK